MPLILETVVTTLNPDSSVHIAPLGITEIADGYCLAPFRPSRTLENLLRSGHAVINLIDDVRIFAGCLTGRRDWPTQPAALIEGAVLTAAQAHHEIRVRQSNDDPIRPSFDCERVHSQHHAAFRGMNRASSAVLEAAILVSRLDRLSAAKIAAEIEYLKIAIDKTAGPNERQAWDWLMEKINQSGVTDENN